MVSSNHQLISLLSCSCLVLAIVPVASFRGSSPFLFRLKPPCQPFDDVLQPILGRNPAGGTLLYSTNPTGRKRRRKKESSDDDNTSDTVSSTAENGRINELPDFDINDDGVISSSAATKTKNSGTVVDPLIGTITPNMMASTPARATNRAVTNSILSVNELRDRSLEQKLEILYDEAEKSTQDLPDLLTLQKERKKVTTEQILLSASSMSKKERQTLARQQQDMEQEQNKKAMLNAQETDDNPFSKLPFITNESGKVEPLKLLEAATWTCIIALVLWEVYINSPLFSRAAPIIPIVYEIWI